MFRRFDLLFGLAMALAHTAVAGTPPAPKPTPVPRYLQTGVHPPTHLRGAIAVAAAGGTVNVCMAGDSTALGTPAGVNYGDGLWFSLQAALQAQNPGVTFNFINYALPGTTYNHYAGNQYARAQAYNQTWYAGQANWNQYVAQGNCHIIFHAWGVNDTFGLTTQQIKVALDADAGFPVKPGIILITPHAANPGAGPPFSTLPFQAGYVAAGSLIRSVTQVGSSGYTAAFTNNVPPLGLIDVGRYFHQAAFGKDFGDQSCVDDRASLPSLVNVPLNATTPYTLPATDGDFDFKFGFQYQFDALKDKATIALTVGAMDGGIGNVSVIINPTSAGAVVQYINGASTINKVYNQVLTGVTLNIQVTSKDSYLTLQLNNITVFGKRVIKPTAPFTPKLTMSGALAPTNSTMTILTWSKCKARVYNRVLSAAEAWGPAVAAASAASAQVAGDTTVTVDQIPAIVYVGMPVTDVPSPNAIPSGTTVTAIDRNTNIITLSDAIPSGQTVAIGDAISFGTPIGTAGGNGINHSASAALNYVNWAGAMATNLCLICYTPNGTAAKSWDTQTPLTGATITAAVGLRELTVNPAADLAELTVVLPTQPMDRDDFNFVSTKNIATLTINGGTTAVTANTRLVWRYNTSLTAWVRWQ